MTYNKKLLSLVLIHFFLCMYSMILYFDWWSLLMAYIFAKLFNMLGHEIALHRLWSHKSFRTTKFKEIILHLFSLPILFGSSIVYSGVHRQHHKYADTDKDPHLETIFEKLFYIRKKEFKINLREVYDLLKDPVHKFVHDNYLRINFLLLLIFLITIGPIYTGWTLSFIVSYMWIGGLMINSLGHYPKLGYRNFNTQDKSTNNYILQFLFPGLGLHNNHHAYPGNFKLSMKKGEIDFTGWIIEKIFIYKHEE